MYTAFRTDSPLSYTSITPSATPELTGLSPAPRPRLRIASGLPCDENVPQPRVPLPRANETPSTAGGSTSSRATFWSAVGSVPDEDEYDFHPVTKADSGILVSPVLPPSPVRRESISSGGSTARGSHKSSFTATHSSSSSSHSKSRSKTYPKLSSHASSTHSSQRPRRPSRQSTSTSTWTSSTATTAVPPTKTSRTSIDSPPRAYTKPTRADIRESLGQKYPNDRCHGAFLPFRSEFAHSKDSLCPVVFASGVPDAPGSSGSTLTPAAVQGATVLSEKGPELGPVTIDWKGNAARRREYEAADQRTKGWRKWCCGMFGRKERVFWDGDDGGSVRRYRLDLPPESSEEVEEIAVREKEIQKEILQNGVAGVRIGVEIQGGRWSGEDRRDERRDERREERRLSRQQRRSSRSV